jgi:hypothetical protein
MDLIANILIFPISFLFILLSNKIVISVLFTGNTMEILELFLNIIKGNPTTNDFGLWAPQILGGGGIAGAGLIAVGAISISTLFLLSKLPEMIPQFIFMLKPSPWGQAIGQGMGQFGSKVGGYGKFGWNTGVDVVGGGISTGAGPFANINKEIEGLSKTPGTAKQAGDVFRNIFRAK